MKEILFDLLKIHSPSGEESGVVQYIKKFLVNLRTEFKIDDMGNIYAYVPGEGESVLLTAHMDAISNGISPIPLEKNSIISSENEAILGLDDKASIAIVLDLLQNMKGEKHKPIEIIFTVQEEPGCLGATHIFENTFFDIKSKVGISFDLPQTVGSILKSAAGIWRGTYKFIGNSAHSARPEEGKNALAFASAWSLEFLQRKSKKRKVNIGHFVAGNLNSFNVVPDLAELEIEIRSFNDIEEEYFELCESLRDLDIDTKLVNTHVRLQQYIHSKEDMWLKNIKKCMELCSIESIDIAQSFGGADANVFQEHGINVAVLGNGVQKTHSVHEQVHLDELKRASELLRKLVE